MNMKKLPVINAEPKKRVQHRFFNFTYSKKYDEMWNSLYWRFAKKKYMDLIWETEGKLKEFTVENKMLTIVAPDED
jgi:hypothetical protein